MWGINAVVALALAVGVQVRGDAGLGTSSLAALRPADLPGPQLFPPELLTNSTYALPCRDDQPIAKGVVQQLSGAGQVNPEFVLLPTAIPRDVIAKVINQWWDPCGLQHLPVHPVLSDL